jgi:putative ABC transport system substrate-binding protein
MSFWQRTGMLALALLAIPYGTDGAAQTLPVMGYVAAKNANPKRLEVFKQGLTELGYVRGKIFGSNTARPSWMPNITP